MERIIHQVEAFLEKVFTVHAYNITDLDATASALKKDSEELSRGILQILVEEMNLAFRNDKMARKDMGLVIKEKERPRCLLTELGEVRFNRDYYYNKNTDSYESPIDKMLSIDPRTRIGPEICSQLVTKATVESYERSAQDVTGGLVSRQSVRNQILKAPILEKQPDDEMKRIKVLEVYADEDHAHLQKPGKEKGKKNRMMPLVTVAEGIRAVGRTRNETINPMHFVDEELNPNRVWASVEGYIEKAYDMDYLEEIRLHGDGALWIKRGLENFTNVLRAMDKWHIQDHISSIERRFPGRHVRMRINKAIAEKNLDVAEAIFDSLMRQCKNKKDYESVRDVQNLLFKNWEEITNAYKEEMSGSCTEAQISHVLSERFSRNPMGWSEEGLGKLSKLRVYCKNGGEIKAEHFKTSYEADESYKAYAERILDAQIGKYDLSWLSDMRETYVFDTTSGTQKAIKNLGKMRSGFAS